MAVRKVAITRKESGWKDLSNRINRAMEDPKFRKAVDEFIELTTS